MSDTHDPADAPRHEAPRPAASLDRTISPIAGRLGSRPAGKGVALLGLLAGCAVFVAATWGREPASPKPAREQPARQVVPFEPLKAPSRPTLADPGPNPPLLTPGAPDPYVPALQPDRASDGSRASETAKARRAELAAVRGAPILAYSQGRPQAPARPETAAVSTAAAHELDQLRQASTIGRARATRLPDRNFLIVAGSAIPCVLQTAMDTATPGYVSCLVPRDVLSENGAVVLMEKGTKVFGEYRASLRQGQRRLFVLWTRAVTPGGVAIALASPAADPLGRAGFDGEIDTHFWDRFGGALLLSVIDSGVYAAVGRSGSEDVVRLPSDAAGIALQNSVNIPPSLRKAQGSEVAIFVAQDLDFSGVYGLKGR